MQATTLTMKDAIRGGRPVCVLLVSGIVYWPLVEYFRERNFGLESERCYALAVSRFIVWLGQKEAMSPSLKRGDAGPAIAVPSSGFNKELFNSFLHDLLYGTIGADGDESGLWWKCSSSKTIKSTSQRIAEFSDWLADAYETTAINPKDRHASMSEKIMAMKSFANKKGTSLLSHVKSQKDAREKALSTRKVAAPGKPIAVLDQVAMFPLSSIDDLLWKGFENEDYKNDSRPWKRWNLRDILITLICLYGGTRESEPLHLWVDDVFEDPTDQQSCQVLIHHPEEGLVEMPDPITGKTVSMNRRDFLAMHCGGKKPLTMETGRRHSGWKGCLLTERKRKAFHVFWIDAEAGRLFKSLWSLYIMHVRQVQPKTPWAFLSRDGQPLGTAAYIDSFKHAIEKVGLVASKWNGTTPHGLRHRYGQWLNDLGIDSKHGQICMHHASVLSQETYRQHTHAEIASALKIAASSPLRIQVAGLANFGGDPQP